MTGIPVSAISIFLFFTACTRAPLAGRGCTLCLLLILLWLDWLVVSARASFLTGLLIRLYALALALWLLLLLLHLIYVLGILLLYRVELRIVSPPLRLLDLALALPIVLLVTLHLG